MSVKKEAFKNLGEYLMARLQVYDPVNFPDGVLTPEMNLPGLKMFDKQMGQFQHLELAQFVPLPAILMSYRKTNWQSLGRGVQNGDGIFTFWVYFENYADSFQGAISQDLALRFFEYNEIVHQLLQDYEAPGLFTALDRVSDEDDEDQDMVIATVNEYGTIITDRSADQMRHYVAVDDTTATGKYVKPLVRPDEPDCNNGFII